MIKRFTHILGVLMILLSSCQNDDSQVTFNEIDDPEALSIEEVAILDNIPDDSGYNTSTVILPNGLTIDEFWQEIDDLFENSEIRMNNSSYGSLGPQDARNLLISNINVAAMDLINRSNYQKPNEGENKPAQNGIGYSWGGKDHTKRQRPPGPGTLCSHEIYGLDCSGFIHQIFNIADVNMIIGPANSQRQPTTVENAIKNSIPELNKIKVEDLGSIPQSEFQSGDIISWINKNGRATHIGMILKKNGGLAVFQSNGDVGRSTEECEKNISTRRGARCLKLDNPYWFGSSKTYRITRINADLSGEWKLYLRCQGQSKDAIEFDLSFPTASENSFEVSGVGTDYDGQSFNCTISFNYDSNTNILNGVSYITKPANPTFYRYDSFTIQLNRDETPYFSFVLGDNENAGCPVEGRLFNRENNDGLQDIIMELQSIDSKIKLFK